MSWEHITLDKLTVSGLLGLAILMILTGALIPRRTYNEKKEECERWRQAYDTSEEARRTSDAQSAELLEVARTTHALLVALFKNSEAVKQIELMKTSGDQNVAS